LKSGQQDGTQIELPEPELVSTKKITVIMTGGKMSKTLHLARCLRSFAEANNQIQLKIVILESVRFRYNATRFSRCVDHFVPISSPRDSEEAYMDGIYNVCLEYDATHFLPVAAPVEAVCDALLKPRLERELGVSVLHTDHDLCCILDDKHRFGCFLRNILSVRSPRTYQVSTNQALREWNKVFHKDRKLGKLPRSIVLKNLQYDPIHRLDLFQLPADGITLEHYLSKIKNDGNPITEKQPWQLQEFLIDGKEYSAMIVVRSNFLMTMTCCQSSASQLNYIHVQVPAIQAWLDSFMTALQQSEYTLTGQLCFDFMVVKESGEDVAYPIECNPRVHTQCTIYNTNKTRSLLGHMLLNDQPLAHLKEKMSALLYQDYGPESDQPETFWFYNEFFKIFPNDWLLQYCDDKDCWTRSKLIFSGDETRKPRNALDYCVLVFYLPAFFLAMMLALPVIFLQVFVTRLFASKQSLSPGLQLSACDHTMAIAIRTKHFVERLVDRSCNIEADMWEKDPVPFLAKNHLQVPVRLLATIRTGVEWKKIDFAIGKVVEVGGD